MLSVKFKKLNIDVPTPSYAKAGDAGLDLTATSKEIKDGRIIYGTGLAFEIPEGYVGLLFPRSSINKYDMRLTNCVGVLDSGYRGEVKFIFENDNMKMRSMTETAFWDSVTVQTPAHKEYEVGDRIGQLIVLPYPTVLLQEVSELSETERGSGGFGHSGT